MLAETCSVFSGTMNLFISSTPFINCLLVRFLNNFPRINSETDGYHIINEHNPSLPIYYDRSEHIYRVASGYEEHPVVGISWKGAALIAYLLGGRLPYEKEWEYFSTSGNSEWEFPWGNESPTKERANYGEYIGDTTPVKRYPCTKWGLYDVAGNVEEWCIDNYHPNYPYLGLGRIGNTRLTEKTVKGGCWNKAEELLKCKTRRGKWHKVGTVGIGFRIVWESKDEEVGDQKWLQV